MDHGHTIPPPPPPRASGPDDEEYNSLTNDQLLELAELIEEETEHFGFLLRQKACIELFDHFRVQMNMDELLWLLFIRTPEIRVDQITEYNNYVDAIRRIEKLYRIPMSMPWDHFRSAVSNEVGNASIKSKRLINLKSVSPLLHHIDSMDELRDIVGHSTFANLDRDWHNKFEQTFPDAGPEGANIPTFPTSSSNIPQNQEISQRAQHVNFKKAKLWLGRAKKLLNGFFNDCGPTPRPENDGPIERPVQHLLLVFFRGLVERFLFEIVGSESIFISTVISKDIQRFITRNHSAVFPNEEEIFPELQSSNLTGNDHKISDKNVSDLIFYLEDECKTMVRSGATSDVHIKRTVTPISFLKVKAGNLDYFLDKNERGKLSIDTEEKFNHFSDLLKQCVRSQIDFRCTGSFTLATKNTQIVFFPDKCASKEEWDSTEHDFAFPGLADSPSDNYGVWPLRYITFQNGIAILKNEATGEDVRVTLQAFYAAFCYQQAKVVKLQRAHEKDNSEVAKESSKINHTVAEDDDDIILPRLSNSFKNILLYKRFMNLPLIDHSMVVNPEDGSEQAPSKDKNFKPEAQMGEICQKRNSENAFGPSTAGVERTKRADLTEKLVNTHELTNELSENESRVGSSPTSCESFELLGDHPELPVDVSYKTEFFSAIESKREFTFEILQNGKDYYTQIFLFTANEICLFFPSIVKSCPVLAQRPPDEKLVMKVYDHGYREAELLYGSSCRGNYEFQSSYEEDCEEMKEAFNTEVKILSRIQKYNRMERSMKLENEFGEVPDLINSPAIVCFGHLNFECLTLNPFDLYGNFMIMEYIESDESPAEMKDRDCLSKKLFDEGLHQLELLKRLKIIPGDLEHSNMIISKGKLYLIDFKSGAIGERYDDKRFKKS